MTSPKSSDWQLRRSDFNHQWLKNRLLSALDTAKNLVCGRIRSVSYLKELIEVDISEWNERREDLENLLNDFETEMSPRQLLEIPPLHNWEPSTREVFSDLLHELWLARYPVADWIRRAKDAASEVNARYDCICQTAPSDSEGRVRPEFESELEKFRAACRALSEAVEKFPNRILVA